MLIKISNIKYNPFRRTRDYPISRDRVDSLKASIMETSFWDNIIVRSHPSKEGKYELAYGHHRLVALQELLEEGSIEEEIDVPIRDLSNDMMLKIMANENYEEYDVSALSVMSTVKEVRNYLTKEIRACNSYEEFLGVQETEQNVEGGTMSHMIHGLRKELIPDKQVWGNIKDHLKKQKYVGSLLIEKFLGKQWSRSRVAKGIASLNAIENTVAPKSRKELEDFVKDKGSKITINEMYEKVRKYKQTPEYKGEMEALEYQIEAMEDITQAKLRGMSDEEIWGDHDEGFRIPEPRTPLGPVGGVTEEQKRPGEVIVWDVRNETNSLVVEGEAFMDNLWDYMYKLNQFNIKPSGEDGTKLGDIVKRLASTCKDLLDILEREEV